MAARKSTRKAAVKKKATKKAARKKTARKKTARKKSAKKKAAGKKKGVKRSSIDLVGKNLPKSLKAFGRQCRRDLTAIEKQIEVAGTGTRRSLARIMRDASHQLGTLEARGEREWRALSRNAKRDIERIIRRVQEATGR